MSVGSRSIFAILLCSLVVTAFWGVARAESITPAQEQEYADAKSAIADARQVQAEKLAPGPLQQAQENLKTARDAREKPDVTLFSRASLLARAYAELAKALAEYATASDQLAATQAEVNKAKLEIEGLKKLP